MAVAEASEVKSVVAALRTAMPGVDVGADVVDALRELDVRAREGQPQLEVSQEAWARQLVTALADCEPAGWVERIGGIRAPQLLLAAALAEGNTQAHEIFERTMIPEVDRVLRRFRIAEDQVTEYRQRVRVRLLVVEPPNLAKITQYTGRGTLDGWVRTATARLVLTELRDEAAHGPIEALPAHLVAASLRLPNLDAERRTLFVSVLREAFTCLEQRERTLLRLRFIENVAAVALARSYNVHESTMSRWLSAARDRLAEHFERLATRRVGDTDGLRDLLEVMQSRLGSSLQSVFVSSIGE